MRVRFANESYHIEMENFEKSEFKPDKIFFDEIFGNYKGSYISVMKEDYEK